MFACAHLARPYHPVATGPGQLCARLGRSCPPPDLLPSHGSLHPPCASPAHMPPSHVTSMSMCLQAYFSTGSLIKCYLNRVRPESPPQWATAHGSSKDDPIAAMRLACCYNSDGAQEQGRCYSILDACMQSLNLGHVHVTTVSISLTRRATMKATAKHAALKPQSSAEHG